MDYIKWAAKLKDVRLESAVFLLVVFLVISGARWLTAHSWSLQVKNEQQFAFTFTATKKSAAASKPAIAKTGVKALPAGKKAISKKTRTKAAISRHSKG